MANMRINLGSLTGKYAKLIGIPLVTLTSLFLVLIAVGFQITGSDDICLGNSDDPCVSFGTICNPTPNNYDIYNSEEIKLDFSPEIKDYWIFFKDGRVKREFLYNLGINHSTSGWRYENFTNSTKPRADRLYVHRFGAYSCQNYMLVALKNNPEDTIKWGFFSDKFNLDPFFYGIDSPDTEATEITMELGSQINITANLTGYSGEVCVDIDHPDYGDNYTCGTPSANFLFNITYFRETEFNDSSNEVSLALVAGGYNTTYIRSHQYDEIINLTLNLTGGLSGSTYPDDVIIYINNTQEKVIGPLRPLGNSVYLNQTNSSTLPEIILSGTNGTATRYLRLPKLSNVSSAYFNWTPYSTFTSEADCGASGYCSNASQNWTTCGETDSINPPACDDDAYAYDSNATSYAQSLTLGADASSGYTLHELNYTWDVNNPAFITWGVRYGGTVSNGGDGSAAVRYFYFQCYDHNYEVWRTLQTRQCVTGSGSGWCQGTSSPYYEVLTIRDDLISPPGGCLVRNPIQLRLNTTASLPEADDSAYAYIYELDTLATSLGVRWWNTSTHSNLSIEVGIVDGIYEGNWTGELPFANSTQTSNFSGAVNTYLSTCTDTGGYCLVPIYITTNDGHGKIWLSDLNVTYTYNPNPITLGISLVQSFLGNSTNFADIPIKFYSSTDGIINVSDLKLDYTGGNDTINVRVYNSTDEENLSLINYYSKWNYNFPSFVDYFEFIPKSAIAKNVTPYGQTSNTPIFNLTTYNYGGKNMNLSIYLNESNPNSCVDISINTNSTKPTSGSLFNITNQTWIDFSTNLTYLNNTKLWLWADFSCSPNNWSYSWFPDLYIRGCGIDVDVCDERFD
jgi:hypothetical protein